MAEPTETQEAEGEVSQQGIDAMMQETSTEEAPAKESGQQTYKPYDFRNPVRLLKDQTKTLRLIHDTFSQAAEIAVSAALGSELNLELIGLEQSSFQDYVDSLPKPSCIAIYDMLPLHGYGLLQIDSEVMFPLIEKMLGGPGQELQIDRSFTDLELAITKKILELFLMKLRAAWSYVMDLSLQLKEIQTNSSFVRVVSLREMCIVANMSISAGGANGSMSVCLPYVNLEPIASKLSNETMSNRHSAKQTEGVKANHERNFKEVSMDVTAILGSMELTMAQLLFLKSGDILNLNQRIGSPVDLLVGDQVKFKANPGLMGRYRGVSVESEFIEDTGGSA